MRRADRTPRNWLGWLAIPAVATLLGFFFATRTYILYNAYPDNSIGWLEALLPALTDWYLWTLLSPLVIWLALAFPLERGRWLRRLPILLVAGVAISLLKVGLDFEAGRLLPWITESRFGQRARFDTHFNLMTYAVILGLAYAVIYYRRYRERELRASQLETQLTRARLQVLEMQLHPHFLFNTLNAITALLRRDVAAAERVVIRLGELLRITLDNTDRQEVRLKDEIEFLGRYVEIEQTRFGDRLSVDFQIEPETLDAEVPNLILQPLVENAIRHGVARRSGPGRVIVRARRAAGRLELVVIDDGPGLAENRGEAPEEGLGLSNTRERLEQLYGADHAMALETPQGGGLRVRVSIPYNESGRTERPGANSREGAEAP
jgi:two-component system LytT family sensor kinase